MAKEAILFETQNQELNEELNSFLDVLENTSLSDSTGNIVIFTDYGEGVRWLDTQNTDLQNVITFALCENYNHIKFFINEQGNFMSTEINQDNKRITHQYMELKPYTSKAEVDLIIEDFATLKSLRTIKDQITINKYCQPLNRSYNFERAIEEAGCSAKELLNPENALKPIETPFAKVVNPTIQDITGNDVRLNITENLFYQIESENEFRVVIFDDDNKRVSVPKENVELVVVERRKEDFDIER